MFSGGDETAGHAAVDAIRSRVAVRHPAGIRAGVASGSATSALVERSSEALLNARRAGALSRVA